MKQQKKRYVLGAALIALTIITWAWMLGAFSVPVEMEDAATENLKSWADPGVMFIPAVLSVCAGVAGFICLLRAKPNRHGGAT